MTFVFCSLLELACVGYLSRDTGLPKGVSPKKKHKRVRRKSLFERLTTSPSLISLNDDANGAVPLIQTPIVEKVNLDTVDPDKGVLPPAMNLLDDDYGYRPPGLGLNLHLALAKYMLGSVPVYACSCNKRKESVHTSTQTNVLAANGGPVRGPAALSAKKAGERLARRIDRTSCIVFPTLFICFNIGYWFHYLG